MELWIRKSPNIFDSTLIGITPKPIPVGNAFRQTGVAYSAHFVFERGVGINRWHLKNREDLLNKYAYVGTIIGGTRGTRPTFESKETELLIGYTIDTTKKSEILEK